jgi:hypothetical protein
MMAKRKAAAAEAAKPMNLVDEVRDLAQKVPLEKLGAALEKVARARKITGASIDLHFRPADDPYGNVYRYAFFGKVPEIEQGDPMAELNIVTAAGKRFIAKRSKSK